MSERNRRRGGTSWAGVLVGWFAALGAGLILSGIVSAVVGAILSTLGFGGGTEAGVSGLLGVLITLLLAFLIGGYAAGRMAGHSGIKHGLMVALLALVIAVVLTIIGGAAVPGLADLQGATLPNVPDSLPSEVQGIGAILTVSGILALLFPFIGGAMGGAWGAGAGRRRS